MRLFDLYSIRIWERTQKTFLDIDIDFFPGKTKTRKKNEKTGLASLSK